MRGFNPDQLKAFLAVVEHGSFTAAARRLSLSQPAVSIQIRELEDRCGLALIERSGRKPTLTAAGHDLLIHAKRVVHENDQAMATMRRHKDGSLGRVRLGMSTTTLIYIAGHALRQLRRDHSTMQIAITVGTSPELADLVRDNDLDLAIITLPVDPAHLTTTALLEDDLVAILPSNWTDAPATVTPQYFSEQPLVLEHRAAVLREMVINWLPDARIELDNVLELSHLEAIKGAVAVGIGMSIVPEVLFKDRIVQPGLIVRPLKPRLTRKLAIIQRRDKAVTEAISVTKAMLLEGRDSR